MKDKMLSILLVFFVLFFCFSQVLITKEKQGAFVLVHKIDGESITGELIAVKKNSLLILVGTELMDISINVKDIEYVRVINKSRAPIGGLIGVTSGAAFGTIFGSVIPREGSEHRSYYMLVGSFYFASIGLVSGLIVGALLGKDKVYFLKDSPTEVIENILKTLRAKARVPNN